MNASFRVCVVFFTPWNDIKQRHAHPIIIEYNKKNKYIEIKSGRFSHFDSFLLKKKRHMSVRLSAGKGKKTDGINSIYCRLSHSSLVSKR